ncbi:hypothetical protein [Salinispora cortesiana]|uniref:hypothetical protein n=1 Tax=Salinispora cortesiana TaxID=1305843 RepID=UPI000472C803|nr:hypothetical protein [Salinispora cortesiana]
MSRAKDDDISSAGSVPTSTPTTAAPPPPTPAPTGLDANTKTTCAAVGEDLSSALEEVAEAEGIGPLAGHLAVSAQYSAGAAALYVHTFTDNDQVNSAVEEVANALADLADTWAEAPKKAPSTTDLTIAQQNLTTACAAGQGS